MSDINYTHKHSLSLKQAKQAAQKAADDLAEEYDLRSEWEGDTLHFHRSGVEGRMRVTESAVELDVKLGFLLRPFRASLEEHIERHLTERLSGPVVAKAAKNSRKA
jgi:putative polyhydroxyalkanoate system protein